MFAIWEWRCSVCLVFGSGDVVYVWYMGVEM